MGQVVRAGARPRTGAGTEPPAGTGTTIALVAACGTVGAVAAAGVLGGLYGLLTGGRLSTVVCWWVIAFALPFLPVAALPLGRLRLGRPRRAGPVLLAVLAADVVLLGVTYALLPPGFGLLTCLAYAAGPTLVGYAVVRRRRSDVVLAAAGLLALFALTVPLRALQARVAADAWLRANGDPPRAMLQVVPLPDTEPEPFTWNGTTVAMTFGIRDFFDDPMDTPGSETVVRGYRRPCAGVAESDGDVRLHRRVSATPAGPGLWRCGAGSADTLGYALRRRGLTITLTGGLDEPRTAARAYEARHGAVLRAAILRAHPADDAELWRAEGHVPSDWLTLLVL